MSEDRAINRLTAGIFKPSHDYRVSLQDFPDLDVERVAGDLKLERLGKERGEKDQPATAASAMDEVELKIVERIQSAQKEAHAKLSDELQTYADRLSKLDFESRFAEIRHAAADVKSKFKEEAALGADDLKDLRRRLKEAETERTEFQARYGLRRAPRVTSTSSRVLKLGILAVIFLIETAVNGNFLAVGSETGFIGGLVQAASFAALNISVSFFIALFGVAYLNRPGFFSKLIGLAALALYLAFAFGLNLGLAHLRDLSATIGAEAGRAVVQKLSMSPFALGDINSWAFFGIGLFFSFVSFLDGLYFKDPFPGYEAVEQRRRNAHDAYIHQKDGLIGRLHDIRDETNEKLNEAQRDLGVRRSEYDAILQARSRMINLFTQHEKHLQSTANVLLQRYREANQASRKTKPPKHFGYAWKISAIKVDMAEADVSTRERLDQRIGESQAMLDGHVAAMHEEFDRTLMVYKQIDDMVDDHGQVMKPVSRDATGETSGVAQPEAV